jgi:hypothetical protein
MRISGKAIRIVLTGAAFAALAGCEVGYGDHRDRGFVAVGPAPAPQPEVVVENPPPDAVVVQQEPPQPIVEQPGLAPSPDAVWIGGIYVWDGARYVWQPGRWERPPHPGARYERDQWQRGPHGYFLVRGGWR